ncbi:MAG TPA: hypothetical protein VFS09_10930 [Candidatus Eisenbacteria bacterium]|nr:hypothetical protein [Candidatus Eisenbacteria bacterium]
MRRHLRLALLIVFASALAAAAPPRIALAATPDSPEVVGPSRIFFVDADTVFALVSKQWLSSASRHQEKLLRTSIRLNYWRDHLPSEMRRVYNALGYPTGRVIANPAGHFEERWYYGQMMPPLRFRDGVLLDEDLFDRLRSAR